jgi:hypothetical protein
MQNPYLKACKRPRTIDTHVCVQLLPNPPPQNGPLQSQKAASSLPVNARNEISTHIPLDPTRKSPIGLGSSVVDLSACSDMNELSFDAGVDWDAAFALIDQQSTSHDALPTDQNHANSKPLQQHAAENILPEIRPTMTNKDQPEELTVIRKAADDNRDHSQTVLQQQQVTQPVTAAPQPQKQLPQRSIQQQNAFASMRPSTWGTQAKSVKPVDSKLQQQSLTTTPKLPPIIQSLPVSLQYEYPLPTPTFADDDKENGTNTCMRQLLVKHASLSEPLDNGWTLFSHQKRAILRGLVRRRMVMALDMGL